MKKARSNQEQTIVQSRVAAAVRLQPYRPKVHANEKKYDRQKSKRHWQKDREALFLCPHSRSPAVLRITGSACRLSRSRAERASSARMEASA